MGLTLTAFTQVPKEERQAPPMEQLPQEQNQLAVTYDDEIKTDEVPEEILSSISQNYPDYEITGTFRGSDGSYKINMKMDEKKVAAYYGANGEFMRIENYEPEETINDDWR